MSTGGRHIIYPSAVWKMTGRPNCSRHQ